MPKYLIISRLQRDNGPSYLQFGRLRSNRFGENGLTDACRAVFSKQAAPRSHAFFSCHDPLPPDTCCGELRGGLSSRVPGVAYNSLYEAAAESACRQYRVARWFLLPEVGLRPRLGGRAAGNPSQRQARIANPGEHDSRLQICCSAKQPQRCSINVEIQ